MFKKSTILLLIILAFLTSSAQKGTGITTHAASAYWNNLSAGFKHFKNFLGSYQESVSNYTFVVPAGVSKVMIECWGSGAASNGTRGGEAGGYIMTIQDIAAGTSLEISVGWGGRGNVGPANRAGFPATVAWLANSSTYFVRANGGYSGSAGAWQLPNSIHYLRYGNPGEPSNAFYNRKSIFTNTYTLAGGRGGAPYGFPHQMGEGAQYTFLDITNALDTYAVSTDAPIPGAGGGGKSNTTAASLGVYQNGGPGMVLIRW